MLLRLGQGIRVYVRACGVYWYTSIWLEGQRHIRIYVTALSIQCPIKAVASNQSINQSVALSWLTLMIIVITFPEGMALQSCNCVR